MHDPASEVYAKAVIAALASVPGGVNTEAALRALVSLLVFTLSSKLGLTQPRSISMPPRSPPAFAMRPCRWLARWLRLPGDGCIEPKPPPAGLVAWLVAGKQGAGRMGGWGGRQRPQPIGLYGAVRGLARP
jgi:hypothetical protein